MNNKLYSLQCFRGLAALGVVFHHTAQSTNSFVEEMPSKLNSIFHFGFLGVDLFFVISGFIILSSHFDDKKSIDSLRVYCIKRFVRIFPPYWPISISLIIVYLLLPNLSQSAREEISLISSLLLLPDGPPPALSVAWTLIHEIMFYLVFTLYFFSSRIFFCIVTSWVVAIAFVFCKGDGFVLSPVFARLLNPINLEFVFGMYVAYIARSISQYMGGAIVFVSVVLLLLLVVWSPSLEYRFLFGVPFAVLLLGVGLLEKEYKLKSPGWLIKLGDASYSVYLIHNPLVSLTSRVVSRLNGFASWWLCVLIGVSTSILLGVVYHSLVEKPLIRLFRRQFLYIGKR